MVSLTMILLAMLMFACFSKILNKKSKNNQIISSLPLPPGPTPLPFIGCTIQMLLNGQPAFRWIHNLMNQFDTPILCVRLGPSTHVISITSPDLAREILKKQDDLFISRPQFLSASLISDGFQSVIMTPCTEQWKKMKRVLSHEMLAPRIHKWLQPKREEEDGHLLRYICNQIKKQGDDHTMDVNGGLVNIRTVAQHYCGNVIRNMVFGKRLFGEGMEDGGPGVEEIEHVAAIFTMLKYLYAFCVTDYLPWLRRKTDFDGHEMNTMSAIQIVRKYQDPLIDERIDMWNSGARIEKCDLLDVLVTHENPKLTPEEIKALIIDVMIATIDNPSNAVEWIIGEMINDPMILKRAVVELDRVVGHQRLVEEGDISQLNYIKACIKEAFRLYPFAPFIPPHVSTTDTTIGGYFIPKGSHVLLSRFGLGRNPNVWVDPLRFDPDRHLSGKVKQVVLTDDELRMLPFGTGKRGCPGMMLGTTMTIMLLAIMVQGFTWEIPYSQGSVDLVESHDDLCLSKPLVAIAKPRLPLCMYPTN